MRRLLLAFAPICQLAMGSASAEGVLPFSRAETLVSLFETICLVENPNIVLLTARATAMRLRPLDQTTITAPDGTVTGTNIWAGDLKTGPYRLVARKTMGPRGPVTSCAVGGETADADTFRAEAIGMLNLPMPPRTEFSGDGERTFTWDRVRGPWGAQGITIMLRETARNEHAAARMELIATDAGPEPRSRVR